MRFLSLSFARAACAASLSLLAACGSDLSTNDAADAVGSTSLAAVTPISFDLGAKYTTDLAYIDFRVYSSRATRVEVWLYSTASGTQEKVRYVMTKDTATNVWSKRATVSTLSTSYGITGTVYYGYRAWGPNWPYSSSWTKGSTVGFVSDVDANGNRFNPNKLLIDPYALELSHDPQTPSMTDGTIYASGPSYRAIDDGSRAPKGIVLKPDTTSTGGSRPARSRTT